MSQCALKARQEGDNETALKYITKATQGYVGCADIPSLGVVEELMDLYPAAKVILITRDPIKWWQSFNTVFTYVSAWWVPVFASISPSLRWLPWIVDAWVHDADKLASRLDIIKAHNQYIMDLVPKDRLLVMSLGEGWEPICRFLGKPVPDEPFPRVNDAEAADKMAVRIVGKLLIRWIGLFSVIGASLYLGKQAF
ncbi:hypothetical protein BX600DRAFT_389775 [Xylariales sp. PMI_506]|nr:hypothetical protein BX600DRAFT_389775 [Xylariales sp. PMI_506]